MQTHVSGYRRASGYVHSYSQNRTRAQQFADAGTGLVVASIVVLAAIINMLTVLLDVVSLTALAVFGALLGVELYKRRPRRGRRRFTKRVARARPGHRQRPNDTTPRPAPARRTPSPPWDGTAPWGDRDRNAIYRRDGNVLRRVR